MRIIIIEDEQLAAERLEELIQQYDPDVQIVASLDTVQDAVAWFASNPAPDLAFFDIQLADGKSFEIFEQTQVNCPVIFTTAYDEYALKAFQVNSVDYILKPIDFEHLSKAFAKFDQMKSAFAQTTPAITLETMQQVMQSLQKPSYKSRFVVKSGAQLHAVPAGEILYFFHEDKIVWLKRSDGKRFAVDFTLEQLEDLLNPEQFFRLNRKFIANFDAIQGVTAYTNSRLKIQLPGMPDAEKILISRERVKDFKVWFGE